MDRYYIDLSVIQDRDALYDRLAQVLPLPEWCGRNLDALYDVFTSELRNVRIFFRNALQAEQQLGGYFSMFQTMCQEAEEQNPDLQIFFL